MLVVLNTEILVLIDFKRYSEVFVKLINESIKSETYKYNSLYFEFI